MLLYTYVKGSYSYFPLSSINTFIWIGSKNEVMGQEVNLGHQGSSGGGVVLLRNWVGRFCHCGMPQAARKFQEVPKWGERQAKCVCVVCVRGCWVLEKNWTYFIVLFQVSDYWALITCLEGVLCFLSRRFLNKPWESQIVEYRRIAFHGKINKEKEHYGNCMGKESTST